MFRQLRIASPYHELTHLSPHHEYFIAYRPLDRSLPLLSLISQGSFSLRKNAQRIVGYSSNLKPSFLTYSCLQCASVYIVASGINQYDIQLNVFMIVCLKSKTKKHFNQKQHHSSTLLLMACVCTCVCVCVCFIPGARVREQGSFWSVILACLAKGIFEDKEHVSFVSI